MGKKQKITKRKLAAILRESIFTPSNPGPLKVIFDVGDRDYYIKRAMELCAMALEQPFINHKINQLTTAITLLAIAKNEISSKREAGK